MDMGSNTRGDRRSPTSSSDSKGKGVALRHGITLKLLDPTPALASFWVFKSKWLFGFLSLKDTIGASGPTKPGSSGFLGVLRD